MFLLDLGCWYTIKSPRLTSNISTFWRGFSLQVRLLFGGDFYTQSQQTRTNGLEYEGVGIWRGWNMKGWSMKGLEYEGVGIWRGWNTKGLEYEGVRTKVAYQANRDLHFMPLSCSSDNWFQSPKWHIDNSGHAIDSIRKIAQQEWRRVQGSEYVWWPQVDDVIKRYNGKMSVVSKFALQPTGNAVS